MISTTQLLVISFLYILLLFLIAYFSDKNKPKNISTRKKAFVYSLSLAIYCSAWTFYGAVGSASTFGWQYIAIYLGPILMYTLGGSFIKRFIRISHQKNTTSISDFIATRYDRSLAIAALVTVIAVFATIPYIALQIKAVTVGIQVFSVDQSMTIDMGDGIYITIILIIFSILFGTRNINVTEHQYGMMNAIAFESIVKLVAFIFVGIFALYYILDGPKDLYNTIVETPHLNSLFLSKIDTPTFIIQTILAASAIFCLPRQFHVSAVEYHQERDLKFARFIFPLYLLIFSLLIMPILVAGSKVLNTSLLNTDFYVLLLPISQGQGWLAVLVFIGGLSAATGMVVMAAVALSTMISNDLLLPIFLRLKTVYFIKNMDFNKWLLPIRRIAIILLLISSYFFLQFFGLTSSLGSYGLISFSAVIQFAPALVIGMLWRRANKQGAIAGLLVGISCWLYFIWPAFNGEVLGASGYYFNNQSLLTEAVLISVSANIISIFLVSLNTRQSLTEKIQASVYTQKHTPVFDEASKENNIREVRVSDLKAITSLIIGRQKTKTFFNNYSPVIRDDSQVVNQSLIEYAEKLLSSVIGAPSARDLLISTLRSQGMDADTAFNQLNTTSQALKFNRNLVSDTMSKISQGISVFNADHKLVEWNKRYFELMDYKKGFLKIGMDDEELIRFNAARGYFSPSMTDDQIDIRLKNVKDGSSFKYNNLTPSGKVISVEGNGLPDGGYVTTYTDITDYENIVSELKFKEQQMALYTDNVPALLAYLDKNMIFKFANKAFVNSFDLPKNKVINHHIDTVYPKELLKIKKKYLNQAFNNNKQQFETSATKKDQGYFINTYIPHSSKTGAINGIYIVSWDITARRQAQLALEESNVTLENRVLLRTKELNSAIIALEEAKSVAEKANKSKTRFMAAASHDLLQPFNAARLFCEVLIKESSGMTNYQTELINKTDQSLNVAGNIISSLVEFIQLDSGNVEPRKKSFPLQKLLTSLQEQFKEFSSKKSIDFQVLPSEFSVYSDPNLLYRILQNLVGNAVRYTSAGRILITNRIKNNEIQISVWDTGIGIQKEFLNNIFEEFKQYHNPKIVTEEPGLGLGLSISQRTADMLGHRISVKSKFGKGSVFHLYIEIAKNLTQNYQVGIERPEFKVGSNTIKVLCIDNNKQTLDAMKELMSSWNYDVHVCDDENKIGEIVKRKFIPDILIVDYQLNNRRTGVQFVEKFIRKINKKIPAIFVTANFSKRVKVKIDKLNYELLYKPVKPAKLRTTIETIIRNNNTN